MASSGVKIALIGCGVIVVLGIIGTIGGVWWVKRTVSEKFEKVKNVVGTEDSEYGKKAAQLKKDYPFTAPSDGVVSENQFNRFIAVRRAVYDIYKKHAPEFKELENSNQQGSFSGMVKLGGVWNEVRLAQVKALEEQRMSPDEYTYLVMSIYRTWYAKLAKQTTQGQSFTGATTNGLKQQIAAMDQKLQQPNLSDEERKALQQTRNALQTQVDAISKSASMQQMDAMQDVPKANLELFTKHEKEIQQYWMAGLEFIGL